MGTKEHSIAAVTGATGATGAAVDIGASRGLEETRPAHHLMMGKYVGQNGRPSGPQMLV